MERTALTTLLIAAALVVTAIPARAQLNGHNLKGDFGLMSGSQPPPGFYLAPAFFDYSADTLRDRDGDPIRLGPEQRGTLDARLFAGVLWYVTDLKLFGANVGFMAVPSFTNNSLELPVLGVASRTDTALTDLYFQPVNLGWHTPRADFTAGLGVVAPIGEYESRGSDNTGLGMWSFELYAGTTLFFDEKKSWHFATTAFYETHTEKKDTNIEVGDILTLEGGLGKSFLEGALSVGAAYYAQWKLSDDKLGPGFEPPANRRLGKHQVYGFGPELTLPIANRKKLFAFLNARYFWEFGARTTSEGSSLLITATIPIPSIPTN